MNLLQISKGYLGMWLRKNYLLKIFYIIALALCMTYKLNIFYLFTVHSIASVFFEDEYKFLINLPIKTESILKIRYVNAMVMLILGGILGGILSLLTDRFELLPYLNMYFQGIILLLVFMPTTTNREFAIDVDGQSILLMCLFICLNEIPLKGIYLGGFILVELFIIVIGLSFSYKYGLKRLMGDGYEYK